MSIKFYLRRSKPEAEINFIGSIVYYYEDILRAAAVELNLTVGHIVQKPIESLVEFHKNIFSTNYKIPKQ